MEEIPKSKQQENPDPEHQTETKDPPNNPETEKPLINKEDMAKVETIPKVEEREDLITSSTNIEVPIENTGLEL